MYNVFCKINFHTQSAIIIIMNKLSDSKIKLGKKICYLLLILV